MKAEERIRCPVHDLISFKRSRNEDALLWELIQTPTVQRLRRIKQLGFSEFVYPGATHSRLAHVLGAMQMARRMLDVFEKNEAFDAIADLPEQRMATLSAALLHDIGHGPFSHVFEEVCGTMGLEKDHESYTLELLEAPEIKSLLDDAGVFNATKRFFDEEPGYSVFNAVISSQMDCDRLDFLCRDRHHTGIRSAAIDLAWLFDSLRIESVPIDDDSQESEFSFVFEEKGLAVAEEFVIAYMKMYHNVYFHKTTRGVQHLVKDMLLELLQKHCDRPEIKNLRLFRFFQNKGQLSDYEALDDNSILSVAHIAAEHDWDQASVLANRFLRRHPYKCFEIPPTQTGNVGRRKLERFREALREKHIYFIEDILSHRSYKQHAVTDSSFLKNILIKKDGEHESLGSVSLLLKEPAPRVARIYFKTSDDRDAGKAIFQSL
jgi:HD superfamily phosphohydrolase